MILAGDIGGTSARLAVFRVDGGRFHALVEKTFPSREFAGLGEIVRRFVALPDLPRIRHACLGIAGPVRGGRVQTPNLPWVIDSAEIARVLRLEAAELINDLEANAYGIAALEPGDFVLIKPGAADARGNAAVISAGTGLGEAGLYWDGTGHRPFACEGGHTDFAPRNDIEAGLLRHLQAKFGHVSYERVLSGPGLVYIYEFLRDTGAGAESPRVAQAMREQDPSLVISEAARRGECPLSAQALDLFVSVYGAEAGNLALKIMATGGVYVGGGIAPQIVDRLSGPAFAESFMAKGRMSALMEAIPVQVVLNPKAALLGAARRAALRAALI